MRGGAEISYKKSFEKEEDVFSWAKMAFTFYANFFFIFKRSLCVWCRRRLGGASCSSSVEVGGAVSEHEGHDVLEELSFLFVSPRPQDFDFVASEEPLIVLG